MANFYKLQRKKNFLIDSNNNQLVANGVLTKKIEKIPKEINFPQKFQSKETKHTKYLKKLLKTI